MENRNVLDEINKGATMGMDALSMVREKAEDKTFREVIDIEYGKYQDIVDRISKIYPEYSNKEPHETNAMNKMMTWYGIEMKTITDSTTSKLAEILMQGTNMGIIEGKRIQNENKKIDQEVEEILADFIAMQENSVETLKEYL